MRSSAVFYKIPIVLTFNPKTKVFLSVALQIIANSSASLKHDNSSQHNLSKVKFISNTFAPKEIVAMDISIPRRMIVNTT